MTLRRVWPKPDFLQQRRLELGLPFNPGPCPTRFSLVLKGGICGGVLVMLASLTVLMLESRQRFVRDEVAGLTSIEAIVGDAEDQLEKLTKRRSTLEQQTQSIAEQLVAVRSGSALLEHLRQVTPHGVRLLLVADNSSNLVIKGESREWDALQRINALALNLEALPDVLSDGAKVEKAVAEKKRTNEQEQEQIVFTLKANLDSTMKPTASYLRGLGAEGLARRLELLQRQGVLP